MQNYDYLVSRISTHTNTPLEEIERKIEAKRAKLSGLISKEGAAQIVATELGVNFENIQIKIVELVSGMPKVNFLAKVVRIFPIREFNKSGRQGKVANLDVADEGGSIRVVLWDTNHITLIENNEIKEGDTIEIKNASVRNSEVHLSGFSDIKKSGLIVANVKIEQRKQKKILSEVNPGDNVNVRAVIVQIFNPKFFNVCPECNKRVTQSPEGYSCEAHGVISPSERALMNLVIDDGTENIRVVLFSDQIFQLIPEGDLKSPEKLELLRKELLGGEFNFGGSIRKNSFFGNLELITDKVEKINVNSLIEELNRSI